MQPATFVCSNENRKAYFCPQSMDPVGVYVLFFNQGATHGSQMITESEPMLPILFSSQNMSDTLLQTQLLRHWQAHNAVAVVVDDSQQLHDALARAWQNDLAELGGRLPRGKPNSRSTGIQRSNGLPFASFAMQTRANAGLQRCWRLLALSLGRDDPFPKPTGGAFQPATVSSFDGILYTTIDDKFQGLKPHQDTYPPPLGETGQLQALAYVHPPPPGVLRLGCAVAFYPLRDHGLWRDYMLSLVTRWSGSPDCDLRHSPMPGLGSKTGRGKHKQILGGPVLAKRVAKKLTDDELQSAAKQLCPALRTLAACASKCSLLRTEHSWNTAKYLKQWCDSARRTWPQDYKHYDEERFNLLKSMRDGQVTQRNTHQREEKAHERASSCAFSANLIRSAKDCTRRAQKYGSPDKLNTWLLNGGRKRRALTQILQPSGTTTPGQKKVGSLPAFEKSKKKTRR